MTIFNLKITKRHFDYFSAFIIVTIVIYLYIRTDNDDKRLEENYIYTVGTITNIDHFRTKSFYHYQLKIEGKVIEGFITYYGEDFCQDCKFRVEIGDRFYTKVEPNNYNNSKLFLYKPVPDSINYILREGWNKRPPIDMDYLYRVFEKIFVDPD